MKPVETPFACRQKMLESTTRRAAYDTNPVASIVRNYESDRRVRRSFDFIKYWNIENRSGKGVRFSREPAEAGRCSVSVSRSYPACHNVLSSTRLVVRA